MRVLFLSEGNPETRDSWSGISKSVVDHLRAAGHEVLPGDVELYGWDRWTAAAATFSPSRSRWRWRFRLAAVPFALRTRRAEALVRRHPVDVVLQVGATYRAEPPTRTPLFLYCDSNIRMSEQGRASGQSEATVLSVHEIDAIARRELTVYQAASGIFTLSDRVRRSFVEDFGIAPSRVHAVHGGPNFDPAAFGADRPVRPDHRPPTVLFVGRAFGRKGGDRLLQAFREVRARIPNAQLHIVGPSQPVSDDPGVVWRGFLNPDLEADRQLLIEAFRTADVFCLPTRFEPFGIVFLEAMYAGLPCIGTDVWAVPEMIVQGETGWLVPPDDVAALADRLISVLADPAQARRMGEAGRKRARCYFSWQAVVARMLAVITPVLAAVPARRAIT